MEPKKTSSRNEVETVDIRNQRPTINRSPISTSNQGSTRAVIFTAHIGRIS